MVWMLVIVSTWLMCGIAVSRSARVPGGGWRVLAVCFDPLAFALGPRHFPRDSGPSPRRTTRSTMRPAVQRQSMCSSPMPARLCEFGSSVSRWDISA